MSSVVRVSASSPYSGSVWIDPSVGHSTEFTFQYDSDVIIVTVTTPSGSFYNSRSAEFEKDAGLKTMTFTPGNVTQVGSY